MERDLATRLETIQIEATEIDCRRRSCKLELQASDIDALSAAIARLEEPSGLAGVVDGIVITAPESLGATGVRAIVYAEVDR
jgi:hypothetical protein